MTLLLVMIGAAVGAPSRWLLDQAISRRTAAVFPLGTWTINITGSLLLGVVLSAYATESLPLMLVALLGTGFCGGFTTFSTFGFETVRLLETGSTFEAALNVATSLLVGLGAALAGWYLAQGVWG